MSIAIDLQGNSMPDVKGRVAIPNTKRSIGKGINRPY
jgi:hypothetical protein